MPNIRALLPLSGHSPETRIYLGDQDITHMVRGITISSHVAEVTEVQLALIPKEIVDVEAETEMIIYEGIGGERLIPLADAKNVWHCGCNTWNAMRLAECRVCHRPRPEQAVASMEFEIAFRFDVSIYEPNIGEAAMERIRELARHVPPDIWAGYRVQVCNRTADAEERKRAACTPSVSENSSTQLSPPLTQDPDTDNESQN